MTMTGQTEQRPVHRAARVEDRIRALLDQRLRRRGWTARILGFTGYGTTSWVRVLARVLLAPPGTTTGELRLGRGWRRFLSASASGVQVRVTLDGQEHTIVSGRGGYIDTVLPLTSDEGWAEATLQVLGAQSPSVRVPLRILGDSGGLGIVSDIDDTVLVTALPRPLVAAWNTFVRHERRRRPVPGMSTMFSEIRRHHGDVPLIYLSTGPWNVAPVLEVFLRRHGYPPGPLLMTDWGPTPDAWFRSGRTHKRAELGRLLTDLPQMQWLLVGDDGQHDPQIYGEVAARSPERIRAVAIRELTAGEQVRTHGTSAPLPDEEQQPTPYEEVRAPDGFRLLAALRSRDLISG